MILNYEYTYITDAFLPNLTSSDLQSYLESNLELTNFS